MTRALCITGDAARGAFQAGVLTNLRQSDFSHVYGTSSGALNATLFAFAQRSQEIVDEWLSIRGLTDFYAFNWLAAAWRPGLFNNRPLVRKIGDFIRGRLPALPVTVTTTDLRTSQVWYYDPQKGYKDWRDDWRPDPNFPAHVAASATIPGLACTLDAEDQFKDDGGLVDLAPMLVALDDGADDITLLLSRPWGALWDPDWVNPMPWPFKALGAGMRAIEILLQTVAWREIQQAIADPRLKRLTVYAPDYVIPMHLLDFDPVKMKAAVDAGARAVPFVAKGVDDGSHLPPVERLLRIFADIYALPVEPPQKGGA